MIRIVLAGNPNSGKTTIYNYLTGNRERIGNWMGVTVEPKKAKLRRKFTANKNDIEIIDLPGTYSMNSYTRDEILSMEYIKSNDIDAILNVIDINQFERSLVFSLELLSVGKPIVIVLNKHDLAIKQGMNIDIEKLRKLLNSDVFFAQAMKKRGINEALNQLIKTIGERKNEQQ
jgi:ferrous iron transport protein B